MLKKEIKWNPQYSVGHGLMDEQHQWLFDILHRLKQSKIIADKSLINSSVDELLHYSREHFFSEEALMIDVSFPLRDIHVEEHRKFEEKIRGLKFSSEQADAENVKNEVIDFLSDWLLNHILTRDKEYEAFINEGMFQRHVNTRPVIVITGASGLIGRHLVNYLSLDYHLIGISRVKRESNFLISWYQCDISIPEQVDKCLAEIKEKHTNIKGIIHLAAHIDFQDRPSNKWDVVNVNGTQSLISYAVKYQYPFFLYASSIIVMGAVRKLEMLNEDVEMASSMFYGKSKIEGERIVDLYKDKIKVITFRISTVYSSQPHVSFLNFRIANCYNQIFADRFLPSFEGGVAYVNVIDVCHAFFKAIEKNEILKSGEKFIISEAGQLPHITLYRIIGSEINQRMPAVFPINVKLAKWGATILNNIITWNKNDKVRMRPWMAELATIAYCFDIQKAERILEWKPNFHISTHLQLIIQDLLNNPKDWLKSRELRQTPDWLRIPKKEILHFWDQFIGPFLLDFKKICQAAILMNSPTLANEHIFKLYGHGPSGEYHINLHALELPFFIPWRIAKATFFESWPPSLVKFIKTDHGFDYRFFKKIPILEFTNSGETSPNTLTFTVTKGFVVGAQTIYSMRVIGNKTFLFIETRIPKGGLFPERIHNQYMTVHLKNISRNLFVTKLKDGESFYHETKTPKKAIYK